jgi:hypothetical protein
MFLVGRLRALGEKKSLFFTPKRPEDVHLYCLFLVMKMNQSNHGLERQTTAVIAVLLSSGRRFSGFNIHPNG